MTEVEKLGLLINRRIHKVYRSKSSPVAELGTITSNGGLSIPSLGDTIPKGDYLLNKTINREVSVTVAGETVNVPICPMKSGDRVLVLWCGNDPIIAAVLKEGDS